MPSHIPSQDSTASEEPTTSNVPTDLPTQIPCAYGWRHAIECGSTEGWAQEACCLGYECDPDKPGKCKESTPSQELTEVPSHIPSQDSTASQEPTTSNVPTDLPTIPCAYGWRHAIECGSTKEWAQEACCLGYECDPDNPGKCREIMPSQEPTAVPSDVPLNQPTEFSPDMPSQEPTASQKPTASNVPTDLPTQITCAYGWRHAIECGSTEVWAREACCPGYVCDPDKPGKCKESKFKKNIQSDKNAILIMLGNYISTWN